MSFTKFQRTPFLQNISGQLPLNLLINNLEILVICCSLHKKWSFPLGISSVNVTKSAENYHYHFVIFNRKSNLKENLLGLKYLRKKTTTFATPYQPSFFISTFFKVLPSFPLLLSSKTGGTITMQLETHCLNRIILKDKKIVIAKIADTSFWNDIRDHGLST